MRLVRMPLRGPWPPIRVDRGDVGMLTEARGSVRGHVTGSGGHVGHVTGSGGRVGHVTGSGGHVAGVRRGRVVGFVAFVMSGGLWVWGVGFGV